MPPSILRRPLDPVDAQHIDGAPGGSQPESQLLLQRLQEPRWRLVWQVRRRAEIRDTRPFQREVERA
jgi:hypothetical protein